jgi:Tfp pilus assembly protein PilF
MQEKRVNMLLALVVFLLSLAVYIVTMSPTVSFWDAGEFIATSYILGIPHPPGTPLYVLVGRIFSLLPISSVIAVRINFLSAFFAALANLFFYLIISHLLRKSKGFPLSISENINAFIGGIVGSLTIAFSYTYWNNAVEAEVYATASFLTGFVVWCALVWAENRKLPHDKTILLLVVYILGLSWGNHLMTLLTAPAVLAYILLTEFDYGRYRQTLLASIIFVEIVIIPAAALMSLIHSTYWMFLLLAAPLPFILVKDKKVPGYLKIWLISGCLLVLWIFFFRQFLPGLHGLVFLAILIYSFSVPFVKLEGFETLKNWKLWLFALMLFAVALTIHLYLPIRSSLDPAINEATPRTWKMFWEFINRKQYQQGSLLQRRATFSFQLQMFWDYFQWQYVRVTGTFTTVLHGLFLAIGLWGAVGNVMKDRRTFIMLFILFLLSSFGLILYLNFTDHEVRHRDYFYTPAYVFFGIWIGMGASYILELFTSPRVKPLSCATAVVLLALPFAPFKTHYHYVSRANNYIAHDYAYNILNSVDEGGILFTNGDNDTFPLWFLQEVLHVRRDITVANLSLLNTQWYIKQLKAPPHNVPMKLSDSTIDSLYPYRTRSGKVVLLKDMMVKHIINTNQWKRPVYFAVTVSQENREEYQDHLSLEGLVFKLIPEKGKNQINIEKTKHNVYNVYRYRGLDDPTIYKDENTEKLLTNYSAAFSFMAVKYQQEGKTEEAAESLREATRFSPKNVRLYEGLSSLYGELNKPDSVSYYFGKALAVAPTGEDSTDIYLRQCAVFYQMNMFHKAAEVCSLALTHFPHNPNLYGMMVDLYTRTNDHEKVIETLRDYLANINKDDPQALSLLKQYQKIIEEKAALENQSGDSTNVTDFDSLPENEGATR